MNNSNHAEETSTIAALSDKIETLQSDLGTLTKSIADLGKAKGDDAMSAVKTTANVARDVITDQTDTARLHAMELQDQAEDFVKTQPVAALGIAMGAGFLVGFLSTRK